MGPWFLRAREEDRGAIDERTNCAGCADASSVQACAVMTVERLRRTGGALPSDARSRRPVGNMGRVVLTDFLLARITEGEAIALGAGVHKDRGLAECWAQRHLVHLHAEPFHGCVEVSPCTTLRIMALPYAGHPDFEDNWRPANSGTGADRGRHRA
jgi:hypothetical protein